MQTYSITLSREERSFLLELTSNGLHRSQKFLNALTLLACDYGAHQGKCPINEEIARALNTSTIKIDSVKKRFAAGGLDAALYGDNGSRGYAKKANGKFVAHSNVLSRGRQSDGFAPWNLRLLADKFVEIDYIDGISHETGHRVLKCVPGLKP